MIKHQVQVFQGSTFMTNFSSSSLAIRLFALLGSRLLPQLLGFPAVAVSVCFQTGQLLGAAPLSTTLGILDGYGLP